MKILVTGATGFLGYHIAEQLLEQGHEVFNFSRSHTDELAALGVKTRIGNLLNPKTLQEALVDIEAVFHVAGKVGMFGIVLFAKFSLVKTHLRMIVIFPIGAPPTRKLKPLTM